MKYLGACCTVKNEESIILEWMAFHRAAGFEHLILIDNGSSDNTVALIESFPDQDSVSLIKWPQAGSQTDMYDRVLKEFGPRFEWLAFIDADEFLYSTLELDIKHVLSHFCAAAVGAHWFIYGSSGLLERPNGLVIENFRQRAADDFIYNHHVKSIVKPSLTIKPLSSHVFDVAGAFINEDGLSLHLNAPFGYFEDMAPVHRKIRVNHYHTRSRSEYVAKAKRGYFGIDDSKLQESNERFEVMFSSHDRNEIFDDSACRFTKLMQFYLPEGQAF